MLQVPKVIRPTLVRFGKQISSATILIFPLTTCCFPSLPYSLLLYKILSSSSHVSLTVSLFQCWKMVYAIYYSRSKSRSVLALKAISLQDIQYFRRRIDFTVTNEVGLAEWTMTLILVRAIQSHA
jgi:hypothetical protein